MGKKNYGPSDPVVPHPIHGKTSSSVLQLEYSILGDIAWTVVVGSVYATGVVGIFEYTQVESEDVEFLRQGSGRLAFFVAFFLALFINTAFTGFRKVWHDIRSVQGTIHNLFILLRCYLPEDDPAVFVIRDLILATAWAGLAIHDTSNMHEEAKACIRALIPDDAEYKHLVSLGSEDDAAVGVKQAFAMILMVQKKIIIATPKLNSSQEDLPSETMQLLFKLRGTIGTLAYVHGDGNGFHVAYLQFIVMVVFLFLLVFPWIVYTELNPWGTIFITAWFWLIVGGMMQLGCDMMFPLQGSVRINTRGILEAIGNQWSFYD